MSVHDMILRQIYDNLLTFQSALAGKGEGSVEWGRDQPGRMLRLSYRFMRGHWAEVVSFISSSCYLAEGLAGMVSIK